MIYLAISVAVIAIALFYLKIDTLNGRISRIKKEYDKYKELHPETKEELEATERIFLQTMEENEHRAKETSTQMIKEAEQKGIEILRKANDKAESIIHAAEIVAKRVNEAADKKSADIVEAANKESREITTQASRKAENIVKAAEEASQRLILQAQEQVKEVFQPERERIEMLQENLDSQYILPERNVEIPQLVDYSQLMDADGMEHAVVCPDKFTDSFAAIDFEHLTSNQETACSVGLVVVVEGVIVQTLYSLIQPLPDDRKHLATHVHGITENMCKDAPTFADIFMELKLMVGNLPLVAHHAYTERDVLKKACKKCGIDCLLGQDYIIDTYKYTNKKLTESCEEYGIELNNHHNAYDDALACANLYLKIQEKGVHKPVTVKPKPAVAAKKHTRGEARNTSLNFTPDLDKVVYKDNPFYGKYFVVSGFPSSIRDRLIVFLRDTMGGTNRNDVSSKISILVANEGSAGWSKVEKAQYYGCTIMTTHQLMTDIFERYQLEDKWEEVFQEY